MADPAIADGNTIFSNLFELASSTARKLDAVWEQVGCQEDVRKEHLESLVDEFERLCQAKIVEEEEVRDKFLATIEQVREEVASIAGRLGEAPAAVLGEQTTTHPNLMEEVEFLEVRAEELRQRRDARLVTVRGLRERALGMLRQLGAEPGDACLSHDEHDLTQTRVAALEGVCGRLDGEVQERKACVGQLVADCQAAMRELKMDAQSALDVQIMGSLARTSDPSALTGLDPSPSCVGISKDSVKCLTERLADLLAEKRRRAERLKGLGDQIAELWDRLKVPECVREAFSSSVAGLGLDTLEAGERELARLVVLKQQMLGELIEESRALIRKLWEEMETGPEERQDFAPMAVGAEGYCDQLLAVHEAEVARLQERLEVMRPILKLILKRKEILKERMDMEQLQKNSSRLTDRGGKRTEELMRLEKMQKRVKKDLPLLNDKLRKRLVEWQKTETEGNGEPFLFKGVSYLATMDEEEEEWNRYKETQRLEKEAKKREELERYKQNHVNSIHTPGASGNLVPRVGATKSAVKKAAGAPLSAKKPAAAYPPNVPASASKPASACSSASASSLVYETPAKAPPSAQGNPNVPPPPPSGKRGLSSEFSEDQENEASLASSVGSDAGSAS